MKNDLPTNWPSGRYGNTPRNSQTTRSATWQRSRGIHTSRVSQTKKRRGQRTLNTRAWEEKRLNLPGRKWESWRKDGWVTANKGRSKKRPTGHGEEGPPSAERQKEKKEWLGKCRTASGQEKEKEKAAVSLECCGKRQSLPVSACVCHPGPQR